MNSDFILLIYAYVCVCVQYLKNNLNTNAPCIIQTLRSQFKKNNLKTKFRLKTLNSCATFKPPRPLLRRNVYGINISFRVGTRRVPTLKRSKFEYITVETRQAAATRYLWGVGFVFTFVLLFSYFTKHAFREGQVPLQNFLGISNKRLVFIISVSSAL